MEPKERFSLDPFRETEIQRGDVRGLRDPGPTGPPSLKLIHWINFRALRALSLCARGPLHPGPSGPFLAVRLRWPKARINGPRAVFPGARNPWTHPGEPA